MAIANINAQRLRELLHYDPETGLFTWLVVPGRVNRMAGKPAGCVVDSGYIRIRLDDQLHYAHRLAILYVTGEWPKYQVDHADGVRSNNSIKNLRDNPQSFNMQNVRSAKSTSRSGVLGAMTNVRNTFYATIRVNGEVIRLGTFKTAEEAHAAYLEAKRRLHPGCTI